MTVTPVTLIVIALILLAVVAAIILGVRRKRKARQGEGSSSDIYPLW